MFDIEPRLGADDWRRKSNEPRVGPKVGLHLHELHAVEQYVEYEANELGRVRKSISHG